MGVPKYTIGEILLPLMTLSFSERTKTGGVGDDFDAATRDVHKGMRAHERLFKSLVKWSADDPAGFANWGISSLFESEETWRVIAAWYGIDLDDPENRKPSLIDVSTAKSIGMLVWATYSLALCRRVTRRVEHALQVYTKRMERAGEANAEDHLDFLRFLCAEFIDALVQEPYIAAHALDTLHKERPDLFGGHVLMQLLGGFAITHTSLHTNVRLRKSIDFRRLKGETRFEYLLREAPAAALEAWNAGPPENLLSLRTAAAKLLEKPAPDVVEDFKRQQAVREMLWPLAKRTPLSSRERRVFELDMLNWDTKTIARVLGITPSTVRGLRRRYRLKLRATNDS